MKKRFEKPELEVVRLNMADVIATSGVTGTNPADQGSGENGGDSGLSG